MLDGASITTSNVVQAESLLSERDCTVQTVQLLISDLTVPSRVVAVSRLVAEFSAGQYGHFQVVFDMFNDTLNLALPSGLQTIVGYAHRLSLVASSFGTHTAQTSAGRPAHRFVRSFASDKFLTYFFVHFHSPEDIKISTTLSNITFAQPAYHLWTKEKFWPRSFLTTTSPAAFSAPALSSIDPAVRSRI